MKAILLFSFSWLVSTIALGQQANPALDTALAKKLGADEYGLKMYVMVILKTGGNKTTDKHFIDSCFMGHM